MIAYIVGGLIQIVGAALGYEDPLSVGNLVFFVGLCIQLYFQILGVLCTILVVHPLNVMGPTSMWKSIRAAGSSSGMGAPTPTESASKNQPEGGEEDANSSSQSVPQQLQKIKGFDVVLQKPHQHQRRESSDLGVAAVEEERAADSLSNSRGDDEEEEDDTTLADGKSPRHTVIVEDE
jgi:hypothetical protein